MTSPVDTEAGTAGVAAGRPQPQTSVEPAGGPFVRHTQPGRRAMYLATPSFGGVVANPMVASPGYNRGYRIKQTAVTAAGTGGVIAATAGGQDAPYSLYQLVQLKDAFGTPLLTGPGYEMAKLVPLYSGQFGGSDSSQDVQQLPSWTGITAASGAFTFSTYFPFEFAKAYGVISGANASLLPTLQLNLAAAGTLFSTPPSALPTLQTQVDTDFYWLPEGVSVEPPGIGTTCQWIFQPCNPTIPTGGSVIVQLPRLGGYLTTIILELRDANGARVDGFPARPRLYLDGVPLVDSDLATIQDDMAIAMGVGGGVAGSQTAASTNTLAPRPTGTLAFTRKTGLAQRHMGLFDTGEEFLSTNPGTQIEVSGMPWGTIASGPATLNAICGQVVPSGAMIQGLPEA